MVRRYYRLAVAGLCAMVVAAATWIGGGVLPSDGLAFDFAARIAAGWTTPEGVDEAAAVALVLLDDRTLASEEFAPLPRTFLAPYWALLLDSLAAAGARSVGFDLIFEYSPNLFRADFDQPFLRALSEHSERLVLGRSAQTTVAMPYYFALGDDEALALVEMAPDGDGVFRRLVSHFPDEDGVEHPTLIASLLQRAGGPAMPEHALAAPTGPLEMRLPAYSLIDVLRCAESPQVLAQAFGGRMVLVGSALPEEDRKPAADRLFPVPPESEATHAPPEGEGCDLRQAGVSNPLSGTVPGVFVHALIADAVARGLTVQESPLWLATAVAAAAAVLGAAMGFGLSPWTAAAALAAAVTALFLADAALLARHFWLPPSFPIVAAVLSLGIAYSARWLVEERRRRQVQHAFSHYLSPVIVERLAQGSELRLGGEVRDVTVMFADLSGFTALSGLVGPEELMEVTNRYLAHIVDAVEATGGYVDKFIGDAVMAMWGAPAPDDGHPGNAVRAALAAAERIAAARHDDAAHGGHGFSVKIGLCSGQATVGNVGTKRRFNYTAVGETVNIASRMEGLPGQYGCRVVVAEDTARRVAGDFLLCELDRVRVKGKDKPLTIYEPLAALDAAGDELRAYVGRYQEGLRRYRARDFAGALAIWETLRHPIDAGTRITPPEVMAERARRYRADPPPPDWDGVYTAPKE